MQGINTQLFGSGGVGAALDAKLLRLGFTYPYADLVTAHKKLVFLDFADSGRFEYADNKEIHLPDDITLNRAHIKAIEVITSTQMTSTISNPARDIPDTELVKGYFVVIDRWQNTLAKFPLESLIRANNDFKLTFTSFRDVDWAACYVRFTTAAAITSANALVFQVHYD